MSHESSTSPDRLGRALDITAWGALVLVLLQPFVRGLVPPVTTFHNNRLLLLPLLLPILVLAWRRRRLATLPAVVCLALWVGQVVDVSGAERSRTEPADLRLVTLNLGNRRSDPERVLAYLRETKADLVLLQEVGPHHEHGLGERLGALYPEQAWYPLGTPGKAVLARRGLLAERLLDVGAGARALELVLDVGGRELHVLNVHHRGWCGFTGRLTSGVRRVEAWAAERRERGETALLAGDFNSTPGSAVLRRLEGGGFTNAFTQVGGGPGFTFPVAGRYRGWPGPPSHRIDHVLTGPELLVLRARVGGDASSDHLPLEVDLRFGP